MEQTHGAAPPGTPGAPAEQPQWRQDFPIDRPQDDYVARRDFTKFLVLVSGAFVVGQFWIALQNLWRRGAGKPPVRRIASLDALPVGGTLLFFYPGKKDGCVLVRPDDEQLVAYSNECTHLMCPVIPQVDKGRFHCPCHAGYFDLTTGRPTAGPPRRPLTRIELEVRGGDVYATGIEVRDAR